MRARSGRVATDGAGGHGVGRRQSGQGSVEYVGIVVAVGVLIVTLIAMLPPIGDSLTCTVSQAIASVTGGSTECSGGEPKAEGTEHGEDDGDPAPAGAVPNPSPRPQAPPTPPAPGVPWGLDPSSGLVKTMQSTPRGRQTLQWLVDNYVYVEVDNNKDGAWFDHPWFSVFGMGGSGKIVLGGGYDNAMTLIHEANHARYFKEGRSATARLSRDDYIDARITEETDGTVQAVQAAKEFRSAGHSVPPQNGETEYDNAYNSAKASGASDAVAEQKGYDAVRRLFDDGIFLTSNTKEAYPKYYGKDWDSRPCLFGRLGC